MAPTGGGGGGGTDVGLAFLRLAGLGLATHGWRKVLGGGMDDLVSDVESMGFPASLAFAWAAAVSELVGGFLVAIGLFARAAATFAAITLFVAAFLFHASDPFEARERALLYLVAMLAIALLGAGKWSVDGLLRRKS